MPIRSSSPTARSTATKTLVSARQDRTGACSTPMSRSGGNSLAIRSLPATLARDSSVTLGDVKMHDVHFSLHAQGSAVSIRMPGGVSRLLRRGDAMLKEFKEFALKGNVLDLAIGI